MRVINVLLFAILTWLVILLWMGTEDRQQMGMGTTGEVLVPCVDGEFLTWDSTAMQWKCASDWGSPSPGKP